MKIDHLDVVQFHSSPSKETLEENSALEALLELRDAGKVRFVGMSGTLPHLRDHIAMGVFDVFQIPYSAVEREHEAAMASASEKGAGIVIRGGAAKGAPTEGKQAGLQWERWRRARLDDLLGGMSPMGSSSGLRSRTRIWTQLSWARLTRRISRAISISCSKGHCP
jgi:aryl-alcohol dehydrogenase-like predicted oxidoreductase